MVKVLLENGAIIDAKTKDGLTPLHCAARSGHEEVVSTLLENSAPISARSKVRLLYICKKNFKYIFQNITRLNLII